VLLSQSFHQSDALTEWEIHTGTPSITDQNGLHTGDAPLEMCTRRKFSLPLRIEYEICSENPCDYSAYLGHGFVRGLFLQLAGFENTINTVRLDGEDLLKVVQDRVVEPGTWKRVLWNVTDKYISLTVDNELMLNLKSPAGLKLPEYPVGFFVYSPSCLRNVLITSPAKRVGKALEQEDNQSRISQIG